MHLCISETNVNAQTDMLSFKWSYLCSDAFQRLPRWLKLCLEMRGIKWYIAHFIPWDCTCSQTTSLYIFTPFTLQVLQ